MQTNCLFKFFKEIWKLIIIYFSCTTLETSIAPNHLKQTDYIYLTIEFIGVDLLDLHSGSVGFPVLVALSICAQKNIRMDLDIVETLMWEML